MTPLGASRTQALPADIMIHAGGLNPLGGDSGAPTGSGRGLVGLVTDGGGDSSKAKRMSDIYHGAKRIVPGH